MDLTVTTRREGSAATAVISGELDLLTAAELRTALLELLDSGADPVVVDMAHVSFCDSTGLAALLNVYKRARARGAAFTLRDVQPPVRKVFELTGLSAPFGLTTDDDGST